MSCGCLCRIPWSQMFSREWRCSWSSADRRCSNYIWVIDNFIAYQGTPYIRGFTVIISEVSWHSPKGNFTWPGQYLKCFTDITVKFLQSSWYHNWSWKISNNLINTLVPISTLRPEQNGWYFADDIFKCILLDDKCLLTHICIFRPWCVK